MKIKLTIAIALMLVLIACSPSRSPLSTKGHINKTAIKPAANGIPELVTEVPVLPEPAAEVKAETFTVVVNDVEASSLLFALARDAKMNIDIFQGIKGKVTLNAIDQTLEQILSRIADQVEVRYSIENGLLVIRADEPFLRSYKIDYVNIERKTRSDNLISTQIASTGSSAEGGTGNNSLTEVKSETNNLFWATLSNNIGKIISIASADDKKASAVEDSNQILVNKETGFITVKASEKQHDVIQKYIDLIMSSAKRQVLIEATIAEVSLTDEFQSGIDWNSVSNSGNNTFSQSLTGANLGAPPFFTGTITNSTSSLGTLDGSVRLLESFGKVKVLSTPKVMAINNQTAILKVVDNRVYFSIKVDSTTDTNNLTTKVFTSQIHSVPVGIVMQVTPYINDKDEITLNVRPTISRIINYVNDPNPDLAAAGVISEIPEIQVREVESILKINSGDVAIIGGLMQDTLDESDSGVPYISAIPIIGPLFNYSDDSHSKTELVIFIRPKVIRHADINADLVGFKSHLPQFEADVKAE
ncbi:MAG: pilus (MSHA type) biogenesis protein MshL [Gammaproteobacteria bacterium]|nr:pilus (MSHA type) biogenesis protein MshL [Gammaproteobacteria bacterium]